MQVCCVAACTDMQMRISVPPGWGTPVGLGERQPCWAGGRAGVFSELLLWDVDRASDPHPTGQPAPGLAALGTAAGWSPACGAQAQGREEGSRREPVQGGRETVQGEGRWVPWGERRPRAGSHPPSCLWGLTQLPGPPGGVGDSEEDTRGKGVEPGKSLGAG